MTTRYKNIEQLMNAELKEASPNTPIQYPNQDIVKGAVLWLAVHHIPADKESVTLGAHGEDEQLGFFQIDINVLPKTGTKDVLEKADLIATHFENGSRYNRNEIILRVTRSQIDQGRIVGDYYRVSVTVYYAVRFTRS